MAWASAIPDFGGTYFKKQKEAPTSQNNKRIDWPPSL